MAGRKPDFSSNVSDSLSQPKVLLSQIFPRLKLKDEHFVVWNAASTAMIEAMWSLLQEIEPTLSSSDTLRKHTLQSKPHLKAFLDHCCVMCKYMFQIKKCGSRLCSICKPPCLPSDTFEKIKFLSGRGTTNLSQRYMDVPLQKRIVLQLLHLQNARRHSHLLQTSGMLQISLGCYEK